MTPTGAAIQARDLTKTYKYVRALDGLSFSVEAGPTGWPSSTTAGSSPFTGSPGSGR